MKEEIHDIAEAQERFDELIDDTQDSIIKITREGRGVAMLVSAKVFEILSEASRDKAETKK